LVWLLADHACLQPWRLAPVPRAALDGSSVRSAIRRMIAPYGMQGIQILESGL
jgi:hypothetical protein